MGRAFRTRGALASCSGPRRLLWRSLPYGGRIGHEPLLSPSANADHRKVTRARVLKFSVDSQHLPGLTDALDLASIRLAEHPDFRGLLGLQHDNGRHEIEVITLWDGQGLEDTAAESEVSRLLIAEAVDLGVSSKCYEVLSFDPGSTRLPQLSAHAS